MLKANHPGLNHFQKDHHSIAQSHPGHNVGPTSVSKKVDHSKALKSISDIYNAPPQHLLYGVSTEHHPTVHRVDSFGLFDKHADKRHQTFLPNISTSSLKENVILETDVNENENGDDTLVEVPEEEHEDDEDEVVDPKNEEDETDYCYGGYHPVSINEKFGTNKNYRIVRKLGWGHFSTVWLAYDEINESHVAIKIVRSQSNYTQAALDEVKILEIVNQKNPEHPGYGHLVKLFDWFYHEGPNGKHVCMVFEVLGENMLGLISKFSNKDSKDKVSPAGIRLSNLEKTYGGLPISMTKQITKQLLLALDYLHRECGLIHTDIKPENILIEIKNVEKFVKCLKTHERKKSLNCGGCQTPKSNFKRKFSGLESPIKSSKPLPSPLTTTNFDFHEYFSSYKLSNDGSVVNTGKKSSSAGSINYYQDDENTSSHSANNSVSPSTAATAPTSNEPHRLSQFVVSASEADDTDDEDEEDHIHHVITGHIEDNSKILAGPPTFPSSDDNYVYDGLNSRFSSISMDESVNVSQESECDFSTLISIKLADLGNACYNNLHFTNDIQTRQYRSPEILLGHNWGCSTDIWSTACLIFELITGDYLFDPRNGKSYTKDDDHIAQILELVEDHDLTIDFLKECQYSLEYFYPDFKSMRRIKSLKFWDLKSVLVQKYKLDEQLASQVSEFLLPMLKVDPKLRIDAGGWSNHHWLDDVKNSEFVNRPCGCCGEDIKGWSKRHRGN